MEASVGGHYQCARVLCREFNCDCNITAFLGGVTGEFISYISWSWFYLLFLRAFLCRCCGGTCTCIALHLAVNGNFRQITVLLIQSGVDVNYQDKQGCTALHYVKSKTVLKVCAGNLSH